MGVQEIPGSAPTRLHRKGRQGIRAGQRLEASSQQLGDYYDALLAHYGPQRWWPARTRFEVIVGAFLTQNTAWTNVEKALANLRRAKVLNIAGVRRTSTSELEQMLRPSGYFRQKAERLKLFVNHLDERYGGSLNRMFARPTTELRRELLALKGIGPETADAILLYAGGHPVFVVDAYTRRILARHGLLPLTANYEDARSLVEQIMVAKYPVAKYPVAKYAAAKYPNDLAGHYNELHALIVSVGKQHCGPTPKCDGCPLQRFLPSER